MKRFVVPLIVGIAVTMCPVDSQSQTTTVYDHLKCYKMRDPAKFIARVDLKALQTQFGLERCLVKGRGKLFCIPVNKTVTEFVDKSKVPLAPASLPGDDLREDRICYVLKCPKVDLQPETVTDQFGTRKIGRFRPALLCTPAVKGDVPPPKICEDTGPQCNGPCPDPTQVCRPVAGTTNCTCDPDPVPCETSAPQCNGDCPTTAEVCKFVESEQNCFCVPAPTPCSDTATAAQQCSGDCPPGAKCFPAADGTCDCFDVKACANSAAPQCGGFCPVGQTCVEEATAGVCQCL